MPSLCVVFKGLGVAERRHLLFPSVFDATITLTNHPIRESHATLLAATLSVRNVNGPLLLRLKSRLRPPPIAHCDLFACIQRTQSARSTSSHGTSSHGTSSHGTSSYSTSSYGTSSHSMSAYNTSPSSAHDPKPWQDQTLDDTPWTLGYKIAEDMPLKWINGHTIPYVLSFAMERSIDTSGSWPSTQKATPWSDCIKSVLPILMQKDAETVWISQINICFSDGQQTIVPFALAVNGSNVHTYTTIDYKRRSSWSAESALRENFRSWPTIAV